MSVSAAGRGFVVPDDIHFGVDSTQSICHRSITEIVELAVFYIFREVIRECRVVSHAFELIERHDGGPAPGRQDLNILIKIDRLFGEEHPLGEIGKVSPDISHAFALLHDIEKPRRTDIRRPGDHFQDMVQAFEIDCRIRFRPFRHFAEDIRSVNQLLLNHGRYLVPFGHDVISDDAARFSRVERRFEFREIPCVDDPGFIYQHVQTRFDRSFDPIDLAAIATRDDDDVARFFLEHTIQKIVACMNFHLPFCGIFRAQIEARNAIQMFSQIEAERCIDVHFRGNPGIHLFLNQPGMKMARIERHDSNFRHIFLIRRFIGGLRLSARRGAASRQEQCRSDKNRGEI